MFYDLLSHSWSGLLIAALIATIGALVVYAAGRSGWRWLHFPGYGVCALAGLMAVGAVIAIFQIGSSERKYPPMGTLVDVGGYRMHILAEGEPRGQPTVVWIAGGHGSGFTSYHHHKAMRQITRSILFDRPGTGWSDTGPFPRRTAEEAGELLTLLEKAGEKAPFVVVGHSYGGLLAANFARRNKDKVAALVLLDATHPDSLYANRGRADGMAKQVLVNRLLGVAKLFGIQVDPYAAMAKSNKDLARMLDTIYDQLADVKAPLLAIAARPAPNFAAASIYSEFDPKPFRRSAMDLVVYDGDLGDMPVFVVVPADDFKTAIAGMAADEALKARSINFAERMRLRYLDTSSRSKLVYAPAGSSHNFPYEHPDLVHAVVREALDVAAGAPPAAPVGEASTP